MATDTETKTDTETGTQTGTWRVKAGLAQMLKGGVIMDVVTAEHAKIAEDAGACAVMALSGCRRIFAPPEASPGCPTPRLFSRSLAP